MRRPLPMIAVTFAIVALTCAAAADEPSYNADIRPILVENCFSCHGADSAGRKADLRLDLRDAAVESGAIVPGDPDSSVMLDRICSDDPEEVMPPPALKKVLTAEQKQLLERWIAAGAEYEPHWSFSPPVRPELPAVTDDTWVRNPIDRFILARLEAEGLRPAPEADRRTLARRVALDLTGLPPDPAVVAAFVADPSADAYERLVDGLLASLEWGEHRGRHWLDYARYADTHGIHIDNFREMWTYRQWVINAFNRNLPFDRFTILQLAGDLVADHGPDATPAQVLDDRIASGFNRCNITTNEGGIIDEEYLVLYARDRTETTSAVWLGLTTGCAVCHDHKFDPLSQREFYELAAFFNNTTQAAKDGNVQDTPPILTVPQPEDQPRFAELERRLPSAKATVEARRKAARPEFHRWLKEATAESVARLLPHDSPLLDLPGTEGEGTTTRVTLVGKPTDVALTASTKWQEGPLGRPALLLDGRAAELPAAGDFEHDEPFTVSLWVRVPGNDSSYALVSRMDEEANHRGWDVWVQGRRIAMHLVHSWSDDAVKVASTDQLKPDTWTLVTITSDGSGKPEGFTISFDGKPQKLKVENNSFKKTTIRTQVPLVIGGRPKGATAHGVGLAGLSIWGRAFSPGEVEGLARGGALAQVVTLPPDDRPKAAGSLYDWWLKTTDEPYQQAAAALAAIEAEQAAIKKRGTIAHVMHEKAEMPKAHVLDRGEYDKRKDEVGADTPDALPPFPDSLPKNRLGLAQWLLLQDHPLTTRVTVNRFWQEVFGTGLVKTSGDFGITGELPTHPELLDWLAVEFRTGGWDVKQLFKLMVTSATYRQAAVTTPEKLAKDAANRLLSRGPRFRMDAEMVRDHALAASGLLVRQIGGPSVRPYQPEGVWEAVAMDNSNTRFYKPDSGAGLYRRSMYWFWKRSAPPTSLDIFNAPSRESCCVKRERTNTPLQALVALNDPQFVEAARALADRALELGAGDDQRLAFIAERLLARRFSADELPIVKKSLADLSAWYAAHPDDARKLIAVGDSKPRATDAVQLASWTMLTNELMNLDEVLCK
jgi:cytochrome c553